jgi:hypothetical protein
LQLKAGCEEFTDLSDAKLTRDVLLQLLVDSGDISFTRSVGVRVLFPDGAISKFKVDSRDATVEDLKKRISKRLGFHAYSQQLFCMGDGGGEAKVPPLAAHELSSSDRLPVPLGNEDVQLAAVICSSFRWEVLGRWHGVESMPPHKEGQFILSENRLKHIAGPSDFEKCYPAFGNMVVGLDAGCSSSGVFEVQITSACTTLDHHTPNYLASFSEEHKLHLLSSVQPNQVCCGSGVLPDLACCGRGTTTSTVPSYASPLSFLLLCVFDSL